MRVVLILAALLLAAAPTSVTAQPSNLTYHRMLVGEGDQAMLVLVADSPGLTDWGYALVFDPADPTGYREYNLTANCARGFYGDFGTHFSWSSDRSRPAPKLATTLHDRFGIRTGTFTRSTVCEGAHRQGGTVVGRAPAIEEGRKWQRFNATPAVLGRMTCDQLLELMSDAVVEYGFSEQFATTSDRTLSVARAKGCAWTDDFD